jgi:hypothetical protein
LKKKTAVPEEGPQKLKYKATRDPPKEQLDVDHSIKGNDDVSPAKENEELQDTISDSIYETEITETSSSENESTESKDEVEAVQLQMVVKSTPGTSSQYGGEEPPDR